MILHLIMTGILMLMGLASIVLAFISTDIGRIARAIERLQK
jgi:hypothetical protein